VSILPFNPKIAALPVPELAVLAAAAGVALVIGRETRIGAHERLFVRAAVGFGIPGEGPLGLLGAEVQDMS